MTCHSISLFFLFLHFTNIVNQRGLISCYRKRRKYRRHNCKIACSFPYLLLWKLNWMQLQVLGFHSCHWPVLCILAAIRNPHGRSSLAPWMAPSILVRQGQSQEWRQEFPPRTVQVSAHPRSTANGL